MQHVNGIPVYRDDPTSYYDGLVTEPTWFSAQGGVYRCTSHEDNTQVAIKKYLVEDTEQHPNLFVMPKELVENEIYTMTKTAHANILKLKSVYLHEEFVYLVMPYCTGGALQQYVFEHHLTIGQLVHIVQSIASGLAEVHRHGHIHRDIKCDNIFLMRETNEIVIGDFGVVSVTPTADSDIEEAGVCLFWSPEIVQRKVIDCKIDIWALGIVILEILNGGKAPYEDENLTEEDIKERILSNGTPAYPSNLPPLLVNLLDQCLDPDPRSRTSADDILKHDFLHKYEPEPLFPANPIESKNAAAAAMQHTAAPEKLQESEVHAPESKQDGNNNVAVSVEPAAQANAEPSSSDTATVNEPTTPPPKKRQGLSDIRRCRIPVRAFILTEEADGPATAQEKVLGVLRKRQSLSDACWGQGSKLPMFKVITPPPSPAPSPAAAASKEAPSSKRANKPAAGASKPVRKALVRSNTTPAASLAFQAKPSPAATASGKKQPASLSKKSGAKAAAGGGGSLPRPKTVRHQSMTSAADLGNAAAVAPPSPPNRAHRFGYQQAASAKRPASLASSKRSASSSTSQRSLLKPPSSSSAKDPTAAPTTTRLTARRSSSATTNNANKNTSTSTSSAKTSDSNNFKNAKVVRVH